MELRTPPIFEAAPGQSSSQSHYPTAPERLLRNGAWRQMRLVILFGACIVLGYSPLLLNQAQMKFQVVEDIQSKQERYLDADVDTGENADRGVYLNNLEQLGSSLVRLTAGELLDDRTSAGTYLRDPILVIYPILGASGLLLLGPKRGGWLLLAGLIAAVLLPPLLNGKYKHRETATQWRRSVALIPIDHLGSTRKEATSYRAFRVAALSA